MEKETILFGDEELFNIVSINIEKAAVGIRTGVDGPGEKI
jgi:hypothetical protein